MAVSMAIIAVLRTEGGFDLAAAGKFVAGHSLGEYTALTATRAFTLADAARILKARGLAMQEAVAVGEGAMAALIGVELDQAEAFAAEGAGADNHHVGRGLGVHRRRTADRGGAQAGSGQLEEGSALHGVRWAAHRAATVAPVSCAIAARVVCPAFRPSRKSSSLNVA